MNIHREYFKYVIKHKWFVIKAAERVGLPMWRAVLHDMSKFSKAEWLPYAQYFFWTDEQKNEESFYHAGNYAGVYEAIPYGNLVDDRFRIAVNHHYNANPHHWQYWLVYDPVISPDPWALPMPDVYIREMVADWIGAGLAINGNPDPSNWYEKNKHEMILRERTRQRAEELIRLSNTASRATGRQRPAGKRRDL